MHGRRAGVGEGACGAFGWFLTTLGLFDDALVSSRQEWKTSTMVPNEGSAQSQVWRQVTQSRLFVMLEADILGLRLFGCVTLNIPGEELSGICAYRPD